MIALATHREQPKSRAVVLAPGAEVNHRILVVDDSESIHEDFRKILAPNVAEADFDAEEAAVFGEPIPRSHLANFAMDFAFQGDEALELVGGAVTCGERYAVAFLDMRMPPGWDGLITAQKLWEADPDLQIVICTAYSDYSWEEMMEATGSPERLLILKKPFDTIEVLQFAHALTEKWSLVQAARANTAALEQLVLERTADLRGANALLETEIAVRKEAEKTARRGEGEQRELAALLQTERARLVAAQAVAKTGSWEIDLTTGAAIFSQETYRIFELPPGNAEPTHDAFLSLVHPDDRAAVDASFRRSIESHSPGNDEYRIVVEDGRVKVVEEHWEIICDACGEPVLASGTVQDVTERKRAQETLQQEREFLSALVENVADGIVSCDADGIITLFNRATRDFHGLPAEPIAADRWAEHFDLYSPDGKTLLKKEQIPLFRALAEGSVRNAEMVIAPRNGTARRIVASGRAFTNARGSKLGAVVAMHDITAAKEAEEKLSRSHQLMEAVTEGTSDAVYAKDAAGRYLMINTAGAAVLGATPAEVIGRVDSDFFSDETLARIEQRDREIMQTGAMRTDENATTIAGVMHTYLSLKGPLRGAAGQIAGVVGYSRDISDRVRAETALRQSEAELRTLVESIPQIVWITRADGWHLHFNQRWVEYTGLSAEESLGDKWHPAFHPEDRVEAAKRWLEAVETGQAFEMEYRLRRADGNYRWMLGRALPLRDGAGQITKWLGTCTDIEDLKRVAEAARKNEREQRALAAQLEAERARLVAAQTVAKVGDWELDFATGVRSWSAQTYQIFEFGEDQPGLLHDWFLSIVHPEDKARVTATAEASLSLCTPCGQQHRLLMPDGRIKFVAQNWQVFHDPDGRLVRAAGTVQDITASAEAQEVLLRSESNLALAQSVSHTGSWEIVLESTVAEADRDLNWSDEEFRIFGFEPRAVRATQGLFFSLVHPDDRARVDSTFAASLASDVPYNIEHRIIWPDGTEREIHERADFVRERETGAVIRVIGTSQDVTERKKAERTLREQAEMLNLAHDAIVIRRFEDHVITFWNKGAEDLYGWTAAEAIGRRIDDLLYQDQEHYLIAAHAVELSGDYVGELHQVAKDGRNLVVSARANVIRRADGTATSVLVIQTDITAHKKLESQFLRAQRLESIGTLASGVAHDLNNVLAPILMSAPLLREELPSTLKHKIVDTIEKSAERGAQIVRQVLTFARGVEGERVLIDPRHLMKEIAEIAEQTFSKTVLITTRYAEDLDLIEGDPTQLHQVLLNLAVNARDAMPNGGTLTFSAENLEIDEQYAAMTPGTKPGPHVLIHVIDTGTGIPAHVLEKMFDPFFTTKEIGKGSGLGLSTVLGIVNSHGGAITAASTPAGTTFRIILPAAEGQHLEKPAAAADLPQGRGETILVVDDEPAICNVAQVLLVKSGYKVLVAHDGPAALAIFAQQRAEIALVLTDLLMPIMNGLALARIIRKMDADAKVILSTGREDDCSTAELTAIGIAGSLPKPYTQLTLLRTLHRVLHTEVHAS